MEVDKKHDDYQDAAHYWEKMRHVVEGEERVKAEGEKYLPIPTGLKEGINSRSPEYTNYKTRARFLDAVAPAIEGMTGLMGRKKNDFELPEALEYLRDVATDDGLSLRELQGRVESEVCTVGRHILLVDIDDGNNENRPYIATFTAESVINWRGDADALTFLVIEEDVEVVDEDDPFTVAVISQWRVAMLEEGKYVQKLYRKRTSEVAQGESRFYLYDTLYPTFKGDAMTRIPAVIVGSRDLLPKPDAVPLLSAANKCLHYYRQYADYAMQLYMSANGTTAWGTGVTKDEAPQYVGPTEFWYAEDASAQFGFAEISGTGLQAQSNELEAIKSEVAHETVRVLGDKKAAEAAETLRLRFQSQTATLASISFSTTVGLKRALKFCAEWVGAEPEEVKIDPTVEFISEATDAQLLSALFDGVERGFVPDVLLIDYLRRTGMHDMVDEVYRKWAAGMMAMDSGDE